MPPIYGLLALSHARKWKIKIERKKDGTPRGYLSIYTRNLSEKNNSFSIKIVGKIILNRFYSYGNCVHISPLDRCIITSL